MTAYLFWSTCEGNLLQIVALCKGIASYYLYTRRYINVIQFITIVESIVLDFLYAVSDDYVLEGLLATECHLADNLHSLWNGEACLLAHAINQALLVVGINCIAIVLETVAVNLLQSEIEHQVFKLTVFLRVLLKNLQDCFLVFLHPIYYV